MAFFTHHELQLPGPTHDGTEKAIQGIYTIFSTHFALQILSDELGEELQGSPFKAFGYGK
jgi:hypothetical protein